MPTEENFSCDSFSGYKDKYNKVKLTKKVFIEDLGEIKMIYIFIFLGNQFLNMTCFIKIRVDGGGEFFLSLGIQEQLSHLRSNQELLPYRQTESKRVSTTLFDIYSLPT